MKLSDRLISVLFFLITYAGKCKYDEIQCFIQVSIELQFSIQASAV